MIAPEFLAQLRHRHRAELVLVLVLVQLEQLCPGWWLSLEDLADQLCTDRATLNRSVRRLEDLGLLRRASISNSGGTWIWWVARSADDAPRPEDEPAWLLADSVRKGRRERVTISRRWQWAAEHGIPRATLQSLLGGHQQTLRGRWRIVGTPMDRYSL